MIILEKWFSICWISVWNELMFTDVHEIYLHLLKTWENVILIFWCWKMIGIQSFQKAYLTNRSQYYKMSLCCHFSMCTKYHDVLVPHFPLNSINRSPSMDFHVHTSIHLSQSFSGELCDTWVWQSSTSVLRFATSSFCQWQVYIRSEIKWVCEHFSGLAK